MSFKEEIEGEIKRENLRYDNTYNSVAERFANFAAKLIWREIHTFCTEVRFKGELAMAHQLETHIKSYIEGTK